MLHRNGCHRRSIEFDRLDARLLLDGGISQVDLSIPEANVVEVADVVIANSTRGKRGNLTTVEGQ